MTGAHFKLFIDWLAKRAARRIIWHPSDCILTITNSAKRVENMLSAGGEVISSFLSIGSNFGTFPSQRIDKRFTNIT
jgi:hypothetical protein